MLTERERHYIKTYSASRGCYNVIRNPHSPAKNLSLFKVSDEEMLSILNNQKSLSAAARAIGVSLQSLTKHLEENGFVKTVRWYAA
jgi:hypothetical protein